MVVTSQRGRCCIEPTLNTTTALTPQADSKQSLLISLNIHLPFQTQAGIFFENAGFNIRFC